MPVEADARKIERLRAVIRELGSVLVAFSAGADSAFLLRMAHDTLGVRVAAAIGVSPALPAGELGAARRIAREIGARLLVVPTDLMNHAQFLRNDPRRCYHCKHELFARLTALARAEGFAHVAEGTQTDDLRDDRPGREAARRYGVRSPLLDAGLSKAEVRAWSRSIGLSTWGKPAEACLSSRFPYGTPIELKGLQRVDRMERWLRGRGFSVCRVRYYGETARVELLPEELPRMDDPGLRRAMLAAFSAAGFSRVTWDPEGYRGAADLREAATR